MCHNECQLSWLLFVLFINEVNEAHISSIRRLKISTRSSLVGISSVLFSLNVDAIPARTDLQACENDVHSTLTSLSFSAIKRHFSIYLKADFKYMADKFRSAELAKHHN